MLQAMQGNAISSYGILDVNGEDMFDPQYDTDNQGIEVRQISNHKTNYLYFCTKALKREAYTDPQSEKEGRPKQQMLTRPPSYPDENMYHFLNFKL